MTSDSDGKKAISRPLLNRAARPERKHSPLNPDYVDKSNKRYSGNMPPGLLRLSHAYDDEEDSDCGTPPLLLPSIDKPRRHSKVSISESDSESGVKSPWNQEYLNSSPLFMNAKPNRFSRIKETDSDLSTLNDLSRLNLTDDLNNRDLYYSSCSMPKLPKWIDLLDNDGDIDSDLIQISKKCIIRNLHSNN